MSWLDVLDVAIGVTFMFLLLSLMAGALQEMLAWLLKWRSKMLEDWVTDLIQGPQGVAGAVNSALTSLPADLYKHPLIDNLVKGLKNAKPTYFPAESFARALIDTIIKTAPAAPGTQPLPPLPAPAAPPGSPAGSTPAPNPPAYVTDLRNALGRLAPNDPIRHLLENMVLEAGADAEKLRKNIESYFDSAMERLSGWYKRKAYLGLLIFGTIITLALSVDTIEVTKYLSTNKDARELLVKNASTFLEANARTQGASQQTPQAGAGTAPGQTTTAPPASGTDDSAKLPIQCPPPEPPTPPPSASGDQTKTKSAETKSGDQPKGGSAETKPADRAKEKPKDFGACYRYLQKVLAEQKYPIGWGSFHQRLEDARKGEYERLFLLQSLLGWIFTVLAITMGSNFWFDSLRNLMNLRAAGKRPTNGKGGKET